MADQLFKNRQREREDRISRQKKLRADSWLIVCEGKATEPNYFNGLLDYANKLTDNPITFTIEGTGRNTESLVECIDDFFDFADDCVRNMKIPYGKTFAVFDKDSFKPGQFNNAISRAIGKGYIPIWSNECIELWFLLHFILLESNITRTQYFDKLSNIFKKSYGFKYTKSINNIFELIYTPDNFKRAMKNAEKLYDKSCNEKSPSKRCPCTNVHQFVEEMQREMGIKL